MNYPAASHGVSKARQQHETISKQASGYEPAGQSRSSWKVFPIAYISRPAGFHPLFDLGHGAKVVAEKLEEFGFPMQMCYSFSPGSTETAEHGVYSFLKRKT
jgi:hypothetical protein